MTVLDRISSVLRQKSADFAEFRIPGDRILDSLVSQKSFVAEETYLEIRLAQMHLANVREYWQEFIPVASVLTELLFAGRRETVPFIVGPQLLAEVSQIRTSDHIEFRNTRVAGPFPYLGDDVTVFVGLFRIETGNWAKRLLSFIESVAAACDPSTLSSYVKVAGPMVDALQGLFGMSEVEARLASRTAYTRPAPEGPADSRSAGTLQPGYEVRIRASASLFTEEEQRRFWVKDGRLHHGEAETNLRPFQDADFLLVRVDALKFRDDYTSLEFHRVGWKRVMDNIAGGNLEGARRALELLRGNLVQCEDVTVTQRRALMQMYRRKLEEEIAVLADSVEETAQRFEDRQLERPIGEAEVRAALEVAAASVTSAPKSTRPEDLLAEVR